MLLQQYEDGAQVRVQGLAPMHSWAWKHAAFLLNRYNAPDGQTAFERAFLMPYGGCIVQFGEAVFARVQQRSKALADQAGQQRSSWSGDSRWAAGSYKDNQEDAGRLGQIAG